MTSSESVVAMSHANHPEHTPSPHMDDLLDLANTEMECVAEAHSIGDHEKLITLKSVASDGQQCWHYPNGGHIFHVADLMRRFCSAALASGTVTPVIERSKDVTRLLYRCLFAMNAKMHNSLVHSFHSSGSDAGIWPGGPNGDLLPWTRMAMQSNCDLINAATREWALTYEKLALCFFKHEGFGSLVGKSRYAFRFLSASNDVFEDIWRGGNTTDLKLIFDFLPKLQLLIDDTISSLTDNVSLSVLEFEEFQPRYSILREICLEAPTCSELATAVLTKMMRLPASERTCSICHNSWINDVDETTMKVYKQLIGRPDDGSKWLTISEDRRSLDIKEGHEKVPLELMCGHIFCAGCIKQSLENYEPFSCLVRDPYRSLEYKLLEKVKVRYRSNLSAYINIDEFSGCMDSILERDGKCQYKAIRRRRAKQEERRKLAKMREEYEEREGQIMYVGSG